MWRPEKSDLIVATEPDTRTGTWLFVMVVVFLMFVALLTLSLAVTLSLVADTTFSIQAADGSTLEQPTQVGNSIEKLWQGFFSSLSALIGLLGGKVL